MRAKQKATLMTSGSIWKHLVIFAIPLLIGNIFQQMYNTVDSIVVGNFVGTEALAAVGSTGPVINTLIGFFVGLSTGAGVVISQCFGAKDEAKVHDAVHTTVLLTLVLSVVFTFAGILLVPTMLRLMKTPSDVMPESTTYLRIYFAGVSGLMLYNIGAGILRAVGDSRRPLYFLCVSSVLNIAFDLLFVLVFHMGIEGVAYATILSQFISAALILYVLSRSEGCYQLRIRDLHFDMLSLQKIVRIGLPTGIQQAVTSFSNVFVQSYINHFGSACMAGWTAYSKIDQFVILPMQSLSLSSTTFVGQNLGAGDLKRAKKGTKTALFLSVFVTASLTAVLILFARPLLTMFTKESAVLDYGVTFIRLMSPFYVFCCVNQVLAGALRGAGNSQAPMFIMLGSFVVFRQIYLFIGTRFVDSFYYVASGYPAGWLLCSVLVFLYYKKSGWEETFIKTHHIVL